MMNKTGVAAKIIDCQFYERMDLEDGLEPRAPVSCTIADLFSGKCKECGWNPAVWAERLKKLGVEKDDT